MVSQALRADAARNRHQLLESARAVFAERGLDVPLDEIARRAGVGNATLYRRFPNRCDLVAAVFVDTLTDVVAASDRALARPDPWPAFADHLTFLCRSQAEDRAFADLLTSAATGVPELERLRARALDGLSALIERAKASGDLRSDFHHADVVLILMANAGLLARTEDAAPGAWRRHLGYVLAGLRPGHDTQPALDAEQVAQAMRTLGERHGCA